MRKNFQVFTFFIIIFLAGNQNLASQEISAVIKDSLTQEPIPFASIYSSKGTGIMANEEGLFRLHLEAKANDTIYFSCMGYETLSQVASQFRDSIVFLTPKSIALNSVIITNKDLTAKEIIKAIKRDIPDKYELGLTNKKLFFRSSGFQKFKALKVKVKKSSIEEFNQEFWDSTLQKMPRESDWHVEILGNLYGDHTEENQKLELQKALELEDKETTALFENIASAFDTILKQNVKPDSYFKLRTGIISADLESDNLSSSVKDTLTSEEKKVKEKESFLKWRKEILTDLSVSIFEKESLNLSVIKKASKYDFKRINFTYIGDLPVYILSFTPKGNADYTGKIYVDANEMALIRIEYKNIQDIRDISLLGMSFKHYLKEVVLQFKKMNSGKYTLQFFELSDGYESGVDRVFTIVEKNKVVKGRNKQNELKMDINVQIILTQKHQGVIFETETISQEDFDGLKENPSILPVNLTEYDPTFWQGHTIIEPNQAIKNFKVDH